MKVLIAGGSGLIGRALTDYLLMRNIEVTWLVRKPVSYHNINVFTWQPEKNEMDAGALNGVDAIINLAGAGIADKPWTTRRKNEILKSRLDAVNTLLHFLLNTKHKVQSFVNASAIGIYGNQNILHLTENQINDSSDFLATTCNLWENAAKQIETAGINTAILRIGIVISKQGGFLKELLLPFRFKMATVFANGKMIVSWIHITDLCAMFLFAIEHKLNGIYNAVAPDPATNFNLIKTISEFEKPFLTISVPKFALHLLLGQRIEMLLQRAHISSAKIERAGFKFEFAHVGEAIKKELRSA